jgi:transcriptional regulator with XRE-family HTH domain
MPRPAPLLSKKSTTRLLQDVGAQIRGRRKALGVTTAEAAEAAGMSRPTLSRIESGNASVTVGAFAAAAAAVGLRLALISSDLRAAKADALPPEIELDRYPALRRASWHIPYQRTVTPREAFEIYDRNWRHIDRESLTEPERWLVRSLSAAYGRGRDLV